MAKTFNELKNCRLSNIQDESEKEILKSIFKPIEEFSPSILLHGKSQVYWDFDSYRLYEISRGRPTQPAWF